ncbi:MAG: deoxyribose-phosphate aldolase [Synergistaceae bacterium]|jgi:deoxyribose-phosphate aldolase|nr:deoxyribose-phosphate aldolase [Synergistaceae bacterium]
MATDIELLSRKAGRQAALAEAGLADLPPESELAGKIEWTRLRPLLSGDEVREMCKEAVRRGYRGICLPLPWSAHAASLLAAEPVSVSTTVAYPLGTCTEEGKVLETRAARSGKNVDINVVLPVYRLASGDKAGLRSEMEKIREASEGAVLSFYVETPLLDDEGIITAVRSAEMARADRVIGGTGAFGFPTIREVALLQCAAPDWMEIGAVAESTAKGARALPFLIAAGAGSILTEDPLLLLGHSPAK